MAELLGTDGGRLRAVAENYPSLDTDRAEAAASVMELVRGELDWSRAKLLYDDGLVSRTARSSPCRARLQATRRFVASFWLSLLPSDDKKGWHFDLPLPQKGGKGDALSVVRVCHNHFWRKAKGGEEF